MTPHSRRNSITSVSTANTYSSQQIPHLNKSLSRDMSTDNLISVDSKFIKKPTKRVAGSMSPKVAANESFSKSNSITSATSYTSYVSHNSYASNASNVNPNYHQNNNSSPNPNHNHNPNPNNNIAPNNGYRNTGAPPGSFYTKEGVYYFPNGEVFRPRTAPTKRNRPGKIIVDTSFARQNNNTHNHSQNQGYHVSPNHYSPSIGQHMNQSRFPNESPSSSPAIAAPPPLRSAGSYTSLPKSNSLQNVRLANKQNLSKTIRDNKGDIHTNITIDNGSSKMPYEAYKNNSTSSLKNSQKLHSQNITRSEQHHSSNASSSISSSSSNMSNVFQNHHNNNSAANLERSDSNTPSTSISDDHTHHKYHQLQNLHPQQVHNSDEADITSTEDTRGEDFHEHPSESKLQDHKRETLSLSHQQQHQEEIQLRIRSYPSKEQHDPHSNANNETNRESSGSSDQRLSMDSVSDDSGNRRDDATDDTVLSTLNATSEDTFKTATAVSTLRSNSAGHSLSSIGDNLNRHAMHEFGNTSHQDELSKEYANEPLRHSSSSVSEVSMDEDKDSLDETPILSEPIKLQQDKLSRDKDVTKAYEAPEKPILANISDMSFNSTQEDLSRSNGASTVMEQSEQTQPLFSGTGDKSSQGTSTITVPINCSILESRIEDVPDLKPPRQIPKLKKTSSGDSPSDKSGLPEPSIDNDSFVDLYMNDASPELYKLNDLIETHKEESPLRYNRENEGQGSITNQTISVPKSADKLNQQVLSPSYSFSSVPSADFEITSKPFKGLVNDVQDEVPPRGDVQIVDQKIRKHHRHASSTSSAEFINQLKQEISQPAIKEINTVGDPVTPKAGEGAKDEIETPPHDAIPPPPIEKSPGMKVKGKPKKHKHHHHHHHHHHHSHDKKEHEKSALQKSSDVKVGSALKDEVVWTPQLSEFPKVSSLLSNDVASHSTTKDEQATPIKPNLTLDDSVLSKPAPSFHSSKQFHSPQQLHHATVESPKASLFSHSTSIGSTSPSKLSKSSSISNFKSFFKKLKPKEKDANTSPSNLSLNSGASSSPSKKKLHRGLFGFNKFKKEEPSPPSQVQQPENTDANMSRLSVLSEASFKLGALPDFEPESNGLFDDVMLTFDEKFERDLTPTKPPDFVKLSSTTSRSKNGDDVLSEPFLKDDELTREQIADQKLRDETENTGDDGSGGSNDEGEGDQIDTGIDASIDAGAVAIAGANNADTGTWTGTYIDENIEFLKNEGFWSQLDEAAIARQIELEKRSSAIAPRHASEAFTSSTPIKEISDEDNSQELDSSNLSLTSPAVPTSSTNGTAIVVVENDELNNILANLTEEGKRNLPIHLKYIKQFRDYSTIEVEMHKFETLPNNKPKKQSLNNPSILKRRRFQFNSPYEQHQHQQYQQQHGQHGHQQQYQLQMPRGFPPQLQQPSSQLQLNKRVNFNNKIKINETFSSDVYKRYNKSVTQYSLSDPKEISNIKNEVNYYKCNEMLVHESSQNNTHFYY